MRFVRQHRDGTRVRGVARVVGEPGRFTVWVTEGSWRPQRGGGSYSTSAFALAVADVLARRQLRGHACTGDCTGWVADGQPAEPAPPSQSGLWSAQPNA